jgi:hypothetical protein
MISTQEAFHNLIEQIKGTPTIKKTDQLIK